MMENVLVGTWDLEFTAENYEDYLKEIGVSYIARKAAVKVKPRMIITNEGKVWKVRVEANFHSFENSAVEEEEFIETTMDGRKYKAIVYLEKPNKIVHVQRDIKTNEHVSTITREVIGDKLTAIATAGKVTTKRVYKRSTKI